MKVKLYELLRILCEDELRDGERVIIDDNLCYVDLQKKCLRHVTAHNSAENLLYFNKLSYECELIDRK